MVSVQARMARCGVVTASAILLFLVVSRTSSANSDELAHSPAQTIIDGLLEDLQTQDIAGLSALPVEEFSVPDGGVDVMRVRMVESYQVEGVGSDTVELSGWIAVRHGTPYTADGATELNWETAILDTEFVGLELTGYSDVFGPIRVALDPSIPSTGRVGVAVPLPTQLKGHAMTWAGFTSVERP